MLFRSENCDPALTRRLLGGSTLYELAGRQDWEVCVVDTIVLWNLLFLDFSFLAGRHVPLHV